MFSEARFYRTKTDLSHKPVKMEGKNNQEMYFEQIADLILVKKLKDEKETGRMEDKFLEEASSQQSYGSSYECRVCYAM